MLLQWSNPTTVKLLIHTATTLYGYCVPYIISLIQPFVQGEAQSDYSKCAYSLIDEGLLAPTWRQPGYVRQVCTTTSYSSIIISYHELLFELLLIDIHQNCTRTGYEVHAGTA